jgi:hypothetical protein
MRIGHFDVALIYWQSTAKPKKRLSVAGFGNDENWENQETLFWVVWNPI